MSHSARAPRVGGRPLGELVEIERERLTEAVLTALVTELPIYAELPAELINDDIVLAVQASLDLFLSTLADASLPSQDQAEVLAASAVRRAEEGVPLEAVLQAYQVAVRTVIDLLSSHARPEEVGDVVQGVQLGFNFLGVVISIVTASYLDVSGALSGIAADASAARLRALLDGDATEPVTPHVVLTLHLGAHPDELEGAAVPAAATRKLRRLRSQLAVEFPQALASLTPEGGQVVVPMSDHRDPFDVMEASVHRMAQAAGAEVVAVMVVAPSPARVPVAAQMGVELVDLVLRLGRGPGLHRLEDVAFEYQVTRPGPARTLLAASVDPLAEHPQLWQTLKVHLQHGQKRRATAAALHLHPNSIDYRLRAVRALLGRDPSDPGHHSTLNAALVAHEAERESPAVHT